MSEILLGLQSTHDSTGGKWGDRLNELHLYKMEHGDTNVPNKYAPNQTLANWVQTQRANYCKMQQGKHSHMTAAKVAALEKLCFKWRIGSTRNDAPWEERLEDLRKYKQKYGDANVPKGYAPNRSLAKWVSKQRYEYHKLQQGRPSTMTAERVAALEDLEFVWKGNVPWEERLEELRKYKKQHGDANVPQQHHPNLSFGWWVKTQRKEYHKMQKGEPTFMTAARVAALEELGFVWKYTPSFYCSSWEEHLEELRKYKKKHGDANVPTKYHPNKSLGRWAQEQRKQYLHMQQGTPSQMTAERVTALEELGFVWKMKTGPRPDYAKL